MQNGKRIALIIILISTTIMLVTIVAFRQQAQDKPQSKQDEPTLIQEGVMTEKQKKHSKLYNQSAKTRSLIKTTNKDLKIIIGQPYQTDTSSDSAFASQEKYFQRLVCQSNAVVSAKVLNKSSQLSEDKKSVFTDYELQVKNTFKNNSSLNLQVDDIFTLTRSGGAVKLGNRLIEVVDESYKPLFVDDEYIFFLDYLVDSNSFKSSFAEGTLEILGDKIKFFSDSSKHILVNDDLKTFESSIYTLDRQCLEGGK